MDWMASAHSWPTASPVPLTVALNAATSLPMNAKTVSTPLSDAIDVTKAKRPGFIATRLQTLRRSIYARYGELVAAASSGRGSAANYLLTVKCVREHEFQLSSKNLMRGCWCPECAEIEKAELLKAAHARMEKHAKRLGGQCLSKSYSDARAKVLWQCLRKHEWEASWDNVRGKQSWCPTCARTAGRR